MKWAQEHQPIQRQLSQKEVPHGGMQFLEIDEVPSGMYILKIEKGDEELDVKKIFVR